MAARIADTPCLSTRSSSVKQFACITTLRAWPSSRGHVPLKTLRSAPPAPLRGERRRPLLTLPLQLLPALGERFARLLVDPAEAQPLQIRRQVGHQRRVSGDRNPVVRPDPARGSATGPAATVSLLDRSSG